MAWRSLVLKINIQIKLISVAVAHSHIIVQGSRSQEAWPIPWPLGRSGCQGNMNIAPLDWC